MQPSKKLFPVIFNFQETKLKTMTEMRQQGTWSCKNTDKSDHLWIKPVKNRVFKMCCGSNEEKQSVSFTQEQRCSWHALLAACVGARLVFHLPDASSIPPQSLRKLRKRSFSESGKQKQNFISFMQLAIREWMLSSVTHMILNYQNTSFANAVR